MTKTIQWLRSFPPSPKIDDATRREFLIGSAGLLLLPAGCGSGGEEGGNGEASGETRKIRHAFGEVEVPVRPERVIVLNTTAFDPVVALGFTPVASVGNTVSIHQQRLSEVDVVLDAVEPGLEEIAAQTPDLILHAGIEGELFSSGSYEQFSEMAPTVVYDFESDAKWKDYFRFYANALNGLDAADEMLADYEARVEALGSRLGAEAENTSVCVIRVREDGIENFRVDSSFSDSILDEVGFAETPDVPEQLSLELLPDIEADVPFVYTFGGTEAEDQSVEEQLERVTSSPLWERNPAVRNDRAYVVGDYWFGFGLTAANAVLDDIEKRLANDEGAT